MPRAHLKDTTVRNAKAPPGQRLEIWDTVKTGFGLRVTDKGTKTYFVVFRLHGRKIRVTIGTDKQMTLAEARKAAGDILSDAESGKDPRRPKIGSVADLVREFTEEYVERQLKPSSQRETKRLLKAEVLPVLGHREVSAVSRDEILWLIDDVAKRSIYTSNRVRALLSQLFSWAVGKRALTGSPVTGLPRRPKERKRERVLSDKELAAIWKAAGTLPPVFRDYVRVLILTGQRRTQVAGMRRADVDLKAGLWTVPGELTKSGRLLPLPLSKAVTAILEAMPEIADSGLFFTTTGSTPISGFSKMKAALDKAAGVTDWRIHDLRRAMSTGLAQLGVARIVNQRILDHADGSVTSIYERYSHLPEMRAALTAWAEHVERLAEHKES